MSLERGMEKERRGYIMGRASVILSDGYLQLTRNPPTDLPSTHASPHPPPNVLPACHPPLSAAMNVGRWRRGRRWYNTYSRDAEKS